MNPDTVKALLELHRKLPHFVACNHKGTRFYMTVDGLATDIRDRAAVYETWKAAAITADEANNTAAWVGFDWFVEPQ